MDSESLNFSNNACTVDLKVAGGKSQASGFIYKTKPSCDYDYVLTVKHAFQEERESPNLKKISKLTICQRGERKSKLELYGALKDSLFFFDNYDMAFIRVKKKSFPGVKRIVVKSSVEMRDGLSILGHSFIALSRSEETLLECELKDKQRGIIIVK